MEIRGELPTGVPGQNFHFHPHSGAEAVYQQPSMEVLANNYMVMLRGTTFGVRMDNTAATPWCQIKCSFRDWIYKELQRGLRADLPLGNANALPSE